MQSLHISTAALRSVQYALDNTANNLANIDTIGYKRRGVAFSELLADSMGEQPSTDKQRTSPPGLRIGSGVKVGLTRLDMSQGSMKVTDNPTDLMIEGEGFFLVGRNINDPVVENQKYFLTRNGAFHLSPSLAFPDSNVLVNANGDILVSENGTEVTVPVGKSFTIDKEGNIIVDGEPTGDKIPVWKVDNPDQYQQIGNNEFALSAEEKNNLTTIATSIRQGALEASNVDMTREMSLLVGIQRAYQFNARAIAISDQMMGIANSLRNR
jgi:flagellar basal-body rod protein FlgG